MKTIYCPCGAWLLKTIHGVVTKERRRSLVFHPAGIYFTDVGSGSLVGRTAESLGRTTIRCHQCGCYTAFRSETPDTV